MSKHDFSWRDLSTDERRVAASALEREDLSDVVYRWRPQRDVEFNDGLNNRGKPYAESLRDTALRLVQSGLLTVWSADKNASNPEPSADAMDVMKNVDNWWRRVGIPGLVDEIDANPTDDVVEPPGSIQGSWYLDIAPEARLDLTGWEPTPRMDPK